MATAAVPALSVNAVAPEVDAWGLSAKFRAFDTAILEPRSMKADLADGAATLTLLGKAYDILVAPAPWDQPSAVYRPMLDGQHVLIETLDVSAFTGAVAGVGGSRVLVTITPEGVAGHLVAGDETVYFEPVSFVRPGAPPHVTVVYRPADVIVPVGATEEVLDATLSEDTLPLSTVSDPEVENHSPGPNRAMTVWGDKALRDLYGATVAAKATGVWNELNAAFLTAAGFAFTLVDGVFYICDTATCDSDWGMTSTAASTLRDTWAGKLDQWDPVAYDIAHLFTGKDLDGTTIGISYIPGRYAISQIRDGTGTYDGGASDYEAGILVAHEVGHDFNGRHPRATSYTHTHVSNHCHTFVPFTSICVDNHVHNDPYTHYTIMWTPFSHEPGNFQEQPHEFSGGGTSGNLHWIRACNAHGWSGGTYAPGSSTGFGADCTTA